MTRTLLRPLAFAALVAGCGDDQQPDGARQLWDRIHDADYRSWSHAPGYESRRPSQAPHGNEVTIYVNESVATSLAGSAISSWPDGSLIVKDGFDGSSLELVAAMEKRSGKWFWAEWDADGASKYSGSPDTCTGCHQSGADYVRAFALPK